jgi:hypothetical protein
MGGGHNLSAQQTDEKHGWGIKAAFHFVLDTFTVSVVLTKPFGLALFASRLTNSCPIYPYQLTCQESTTGGDRNERSCHCQWFQNSGGVIRRIVEDRSGGKPGRYRYERDP